MKLSSPKKAEHLVGVDLDADGVAAAFVQPGVPPLVGFQPLAPGVVSSGEIADVNAASAALRELFGREKLPKRVRLAVGSQGVAFRTVRLPVIENPEQLKAAVRFQAQEQIPMPLESAIIDHQVIGATTTAEGGRQLDVAVVAARRQSIDTILQAARGAGLEPIGIDLAAFGMIRALAGESGKGKAAGTSQPEYATATLYCSLGGITNLAIARDFACLFSRVVQFSVRGIAEELATSAGLELEHAEQWLVFVGTDKPLDQMEGDPAILGAARAALEANVGRLADEVRLSLDYYGAQEDAAPVDEVVLCGWGSAIPGLPERLGSVLGRPVTVRRPAALAGLSAAEAARMTLPYGLSLDQ